MLVTLSSQSLKNGQESPDFTNFLGVGSMECIVYEKVLHAFCDRGTLENRIALDNANWAFSSEIIGEYAQNKYGMEYRNFLMPLDRRVGSDQFIYIGSPKIQPFTREV